MTTKPDKTPPPDALLEQALAFIAGAPDEEFLQYLKDTGEVSGDLSKMTADAITSAIKAVGQKKLAAAKEEQQRKLDNLQAVQNRISTYGGDARAALSHMVSEATGAGYEVSLQHRLLETQSEEELRATMLDLLVLLESKKRSGQS